VHCVAHGKRLPLREDVLKAMGLDITHSIETIAVNFPKAGMLPGHYLKESYLYSKIVYERLKSRLAEFDFIYAKGFSAWHLLHEKQKDKSIPPVGIKFHGYEMYQKPPSFKARLQNLLLRGPVKWNNLYADYVFSYGNKITEIIQSLGVTDDRIIEIPTGIEKSWLSNKIPTSDVLNFLFIGRYERRKGIEELNLALKSLLPNELFHFHFIGPIPPCGKILSDKITYHGSVMESERIKEITDSCQVLVTPSHSEGMPNVIMEGMARGLAILTTRVGAVESVVDESNGWFVAPGDSVGLANTLRNIIHSDRNLIKQKQQNSQKRITSFLWENIADSTINHIANKH
jgi:glycosyltransferase involved in cell wall biosynthesis